ncbi:hypothetical protein JCM15765_27490 [Paradesulfitobacterium aromaticivorans]
MPILEDIAIDENGNFILSQEGDAATVTDVDVIIQDLADELMTFQGIISWHPEYGGRLQQFVKTENTAAERTAVAREVAAVILRHPNVIPDTVSVTPVLKQGGDLELAVSLNITLDGQNALSASLVVIVGPEGVRVIEA